MEQPVKKIKDYTNRLTITVIGNRCSGKTTLLNSLIFPTIIQKKDYVRTNGYDIRFLSFDNNNDTIIKFFDIGDLDIDKNENVFQAMSWYSHYVIYIIEPKIKECLEYIDIFEDVFKNNYKILIFTKLDEVNNDINVFFKDNSVSEFIKEKNISNIFFVNSFDVDSVNKLRSDLINIVFRDLGNKIFTEIKTEDFFKCPILFHREKSGGSNTKKLGC